MLHTLGMLSMHEYHLTCTHTQCSHLIFLPSQTTGNKNENDSDQMPQCPSVRGVPGASAPCEGVPRTEALGQVGVHRVHPAHRLHQVLSAEPDLHRPLRLQDPSSGKHKRKALFAPDFQVIGHEMEWFNVREK